MNKYLIVFKDGGSAKVEGPLFLLTNDISGGPFTDDYKTIVNMDDVSYITRLEEDDE